MENMAAFEEVGFSLPRVNAAARQIRGEKFSANFYRCTESFSGSWPNDFTPEKTSNSSARVAMLQPCVLAGGSGMPAIRPPSGKPVH